MTTKKITPRRPKKLPYRTPALKTYGDLKTLTMGKGGMRTDAGMPKTRTSGTL